MDLDELIIKINNNMEVVATLKPFKYIDFLRDDLLFVPDIDGLLTVVKSLGDPDNSILLVLNDGQNVEIKIDESLNSYYPVLFVIDEKQYEVVSEEFTDSGVDELREISKPEETNNTVEKVESTMAKEILNSQNIVQYIQDHLISIDSDDKYILEEVKTVQAGSSYGLSALLYDYATTPQMGKLDTGESVKFRQWEESVEHDGAEIGIVIEVNERYFIDYGSYNSWDSSSFNENFTEVQRIEVPVIKVEYRPI